MSKIKLIHISEVTQSPKPRFLIDGLIPMQDITVIWGRPKSGKTFVVLDMALHVASGQPYRDRNVIGGPVVYCALEGATAFPDRLKALTQAYDLALETTPFWLSPDHFTFIKVGGAGDLIRAIRDTLPEPPRLVVVDTLNRSLSGSENSDEDMTHYTRCLEDIGTELGSCSIAVVHHCGVSGDKPRGHTSLTGTCAAQLKVARVTKGPTSEGRDTMICTTVEFMKDGPEGQQIFSWLQPVSLGMDETGQEVVSCCVTPAPAPSGYGDSKKKMSGQTAKALAILQNLITEGKEGKVTLGEWREKCKLARMGSTKEASKKAFYRALERLQSDKVIIIDGQWVSLAEQGKGNGASKGEDLQSGTESSA